MLTQQGVVPYLLRRSLISAREVVEGDLVIAEMSSRNRTFQVISTRGPSYVLKQGVAQDGAATIAHEAAIYQALQSPTPGMVDDPPHPPTSTDGEAGMARPPAFMPRFCAYDAEERVLVLELLAGAPNLREYHTRRGQFPTALATALGDVLGSLHRSTTSAAVPADDGGRPAADPHWILRLHRPTLQILRGASAASMRLLRLLQQSAAPCERLDDLYRAWRTDTLIHGDLRWANCLVAREAVREATAGRGRPKITLVDWELGGWGDPRWDVGAVFASYLDFWLCSIPLTGEAPPERFVQLAQYPIETMQPAIRAFWRAYLRHAQLDHRAVGAWLLGAVGYCGARLLQAAYERTQHETQLSATDLLLVQLSLNTVQRPHEAAVHLLGLPLNAPPPVATRTE